MTTSLSDLARILDALPVNRPALFIALRDPETCAKLLELAHDIHEAHDVMTGQHPACAPDASDLYDKRLEQD